jgi:two-component system, OmpR family, manganese sensing response regulator
VEKLLVVDDDQEYCEVLKRALKLHGLSVEIAYSAGQASQILSETNFDCILLDSNMPEYSGLEFCKEYREKGGSTAVMFVTANKEIEDQEQCFNAGGDDYLAKPFDVRELLLRVKALKRRFRTHSYGSLDFPGLEFVVKLRTVSSNGKKVRLSMTECSILEFLMRNRNAFFTSSQLKKTLWPPESLVSNESIRNHVMLLRRKLALIGLDQLIKTVAGAGYIINDTSEPGRDR